MLMIISNMSEAYQQEVRIDSLMKGAYALIIEAENAVNVQTKSLCKVEFQSGTWVYIGSAMGNGSTSLENRIMRHFRSEKTVFWHIDHLLDKNVKLLKAFWAQNPLPTECDIAQEIQSRNEFQAGPRQFGSSDCRRGCTAHIFRFTNSGEMDAVIEDVFKEVGLQALVTTDGNL